MSQSSKIEWTKATWNPVTGCTKVSPRCAHCYAETMTRRLQAMEQPKYADGFDRIVCHESELDSPILQGKGKRIFVCSMSDPFHPDVPDAFLKRMWDVMWAHPQHTFIVLTKRVERLVKWVRANACRKHFGWTDRDCPPFRCGGSMSMFNCCMRNECGYVAEDEVGCNHPGNNGEQYDDDDGLLLPLCCAYKCPIGSVIDGKKELVGELGYSEDDFYWEVDDNGEEYAVNIEEGIVRLHERPWHAMVANVWLGFTAENQERYEHNARLFRQLRWKLGPYATLFVSFEPLIEAITLPMKYYPDSAGESMWAPTQLYDFSDGGGQLHVPYINWAIVGCESGPQRCPCQLEWVEHLVSGLRATKIPTFVKQLDLSSRVVKDIDQFPEHLRSRDFPEVVT